MKKLIIILILISFMSLNTLGWEEGPCAEVLTRNLHGTYVYQFVIWKCSGYTAWVTYGPMWYVNSKEYAGLKYIMGTGFPPLSAIDWDGDLTDRCNYNDATPSQLWVCQYVINSDDYYNNIPPGTTDFSGWVHVEIGRAGTEYAQAEADAPIENSENPATGGDPVFMSNGEYTHSETDIMINTPRGMPLAVTRTYGSRREYNSRYGYGWDINFNMKVCKLTDPDTVILLTGGGYRREYIREGSTDIFKREAELGAYIEYDFGEDTFKLIDSGWREYQFDSAGNLHSITDRHGNSITLEYDAEISDIYGPSQNVPPAEFGGPTDGRVLVARDYKLRTVTHTTRGDDSQTVVRTLNFVYDDDSDDGSGLLTEISEEIESVSTGRVWSYQYDSITNDLLSMTSPATTEYPDGLTKQFIYGYNHKLESILDAKGQEYIINNYQGDWVIDQKYGESETEGDSKWEFNYDEETNTGTVTDRKGYEKEITYNTDGQVTSETVFTQGVRNSSGFPDPVSYITSYEYYSDTNKQLKKQVLPKGNSVSYTYHSDTGKVETITYSAESDAFSFNGTDDYIGLSSSTYEFPDNTDDFSVALWCKRDIDTTEEYLVDKRDGNDDGWSIYLNNSDYLVFSLNSIDVTSTSTIADNNWHKIVVTIDRDDVAQLYIDDNAAGYGSVSGQSMDVSAALCVGRTSFEGAGYVYFDGTIDNLMIFNKILTQDETECLPDYLPPETIGFWRMNDDKEDAAVVDYSSEGADGISGRYTSLMNTTGFNDGQSITQEYTYEDTFNFVKTSTDPESNVITYEYDYEDQGYGSNIGNLMKITYPQVEIETSEQYDTPITEFTYNAYGQIETITKTCQGDSFYRVTKFEYYDNKSIDGENNYGRVKKIIRDYGTSPCLNITTEYTYDEFGYVHATKYYKEGSPYSTTYTTYDKLGNVIQTTTPLNYTTQYLYDENKKLEQIKSQLGATFDAGDPSTYQLSEFDYNMLDSLKSLTDSLGYETINKYDDNDNIRGVQDPEGAVADYETQYSYDERDLLWTTTDAKGNETFYWYDANGNLWRIKDAKGQVTEYYYDGIDRLKEVIYPDGTTESFTYDDNGNILTKKNRNGYVTSYQYDELDRLRLKDPPDAGPITFWYNIIGELDHVTQGSDTYEYLYDRASRLTQVDDPESRTVQYDYDDLSRITKLTYHESDYVTYDYDTMSRLTDIRDDSGNVIVHYTYDELSRRTDIYINYDRDGDYQEVGDGHVTYDYEDKDKVEPFDNDNFGNRIEALANAVNASDTLTFDYIYDKVGNVDTMVINSNSDSYSYGYDNIYQLLSVDFPPGSWFDISYVYDYDFLGNRKTETINDGTQNPYVIPYVISSNDLNQYDLVDGTSYSYDYNGNLTNDGLYTYHYDSENRLTLVRDNADTTDIAAYTYDYQGRRTEKTVYGSPDVTTKYCYDGDQVITEYDGSDALLRKFIYGPGVDEPIAMIIPGSPDDTWYFYYYDNLGNVIALCDDTGAIVEGYTYDAFGTCVVNTSAGTDSDWLTPDGATASSSAYGNPYQFTGRRYDSETSLYYYRARYYNAEIGRFLQPDPIGYGDGLNVYAYVHNNPVNVVDPLGNSSKYFRPQNMWEGIKDIAYLGPYDAGQKHAIGFHALDWSNTATKIVSRKAFEQNGKIIENEKRADISNALRHAYYSAMLYRNLSENDAEEALLIHEVIELNNIENHDHTADFWNNAIGRDIGLSRGNIEEKVLLAYFKGFLMSKQKDNPLLEPILNTKSEKCK